MKRKGKGSRKTSATRKAPSHASSAAHTAHPLCDERLTALPPSIDIAALATLYNSQPKSQMAHEYLLEEARRSLLKYELAQADLELAADSLARAMHLLIEQRGVNRLPPEELSKLERDILDWYDLVPEASERPRPANATPHEPQPAAEPKPARQNESSTRNHAIHHTH